MLRVALVLAVVLFLDSAAAARQAPPAPPAPPADPAAPPAGEKPADAPAKPEPIVDTSSEATRILREQTAALANKEPRVRAEALQVFLVHRNEIYVKPIAALLKDKNPDVVKLAAQALGNQPFLSSSDALLDFATNPRVFEPDPELAAEAIKAVGSAGLFKKGYERLRAIFDDADKSVKAAIFQALAAQKEKKAFSLFVDHCDEPAPENPNSASNPPASYWKAKYEEWQAYKQYVRRGLKELTGQALATRDQYIEWAAGPGKKLGFVYRRGG